MKTMKAIGKFVSAMVLAASFAGVCGSKAVAQDKPDYQKHIDFSVNDDGPPNCPERYFANALLAQCLALGNRSCVAGVAIEAAYRGQDQLALWLIAEITQCHNEGARIALYGAGAQAVGDYLRTYNRPAWGPALDLAF